MKNCKRKSAAKSVENKETKEKAIKNFFKKPRKSLEIGVSETIDLISDEDDEILCETADKLLNKVNEDSIKDEFYNEKEESLNSEQFVTSDGHSAYLSNFNLVLSLVTEDPFYTNLFDELDRSIIDCFCNKLKVEEQKLYVRLFLRKHQWLRREQISYPRLNHHMDSILHLLVKHSFLTNDISTESMIKILEKLQSGDLKTLAKSLRLDASKKRMGLIFDIEKHSMKKNIASFFQKENKPIEFIKERAIKMVGECYKLTSSHRNLFNRIFTLAYLHESISDNETCGQQLIFKMIQSPMVETPEYTVNKETHIFLHKEALKLYTEMLTEECELYRLVDGKKYEEAAKFYEKFEKMFNYCMDDSPDFRHYSTLPLQLRAYTPPSTFIRITHKAVLVYQSIKLFDKAVKLLLWLLKQPHFHQSSRGKWYNRATINMQFHLKNHHQALQLVGQALQDRMVRTGLRLEILLRGKKILNMKCMKLPTSEDINSEKKIKKSKKLSKNKDELSGKQLLDVKKLIEDDEMNHLKQAPFVTIAGQFIPKINSQGNSYWLVSNKDAVDDEDKDPSYMEDLNDEDDSRDSYSLRRKDSEEMKNCDESRADKFCVGRVEEVALNHYADLGYTEGIHGEGITIVSIFFLLAWEIIFSAGHADTFLNTFQTHPIDLRTDEFYTKRKDQFEELFKTIKDSDVESLGLMAEEQWNKHHNTTTTWTNFTVFNNSSNFKSLIQSLGSRVTEALMRRMATMMRFVVGGVPDLLVWNPTTLKAVFVEVKGPGDKLSYKQLLWIDYLLRCGAEMQVCLVKAHNPKRLV